MNWKNINADNTVFVILSFEGPDPYSMAGGLGVRVTNLAYTLGQLGFSTHLFFIGDPKLPGEEVTAGGKLLLHRWCQWISNYHPHGVYDGENGKFYDFNKSIPHFVTTRVIKPALAKGKMVVVLGEEWHTAETMCRLSDLLQAKGLRDRVLMFWNANNTFSFSRINWTKLASAATITTVSRYMKHIMWGIGVNPLVIPNGIPRSLLSEVDAFASNWMRESLNAEIVLAKVARWDPDKRWLMAVDAVADLKSAGVKTVLLARGGMESHGQEVMQRAHSLGLKIKDVYTRGNNLTDYMGAIGGNAGADILNIKFRCPAEFLRIIYHASDAVLANSGHEPFGLVGLETMASGGVAFTGGTGEDYAIHLHNSIVLETANPKEIETYVLYLGEHVEERERLRRAGRSTAIRYIWEEVIRYLIEKLEYQARIQELLVLSPALRTGLPVTSTSRRRDLLRQAGQGDKELAFK